MRKFSSRRKGNKSRRGLISSHSVDFNLVTRAEKQREKGRGKLSARGKLSFRFYFVSHSSLWSLIPRTKTTTTCTSVLIRGGEDSLTFLIKTRIYFNKFIEKLIGHQIKYMFSKEFKKRFILSPPRSKRKKNKFARLNTRKYKRSLLNLNLTFNPLQTLRQILFFPSFPRKISPSSRNHKNPSAIPTNPSRPPRNWTHPSSVQHPFRLLTRTPRKIPRKRKRNSNRLSSSIYRDVPKN